MKKLDNGGWSMSVMITFIGVFVFFLIVVALIAHNFGIGKHSPDPLYPDVEESEELDTLEED